MVIKNMKSGKAVSGLINYQFEGKLEDHKDKKEEIITGSQDLILPIDKEDKQGIKNLKSDFDRRTHEYLLHNPDNKNNLIGHQMISFTKDDEKRLGKDGTRKVLDDYLELSGIKNTQYIAISHGDTANNHIHIIYHKVHNDGKKVNEWKLNNKTLERGVVLSLRHKLDLVKDQNKVAMTKPVIELRSKDIDIKNLRNSSAELKISKNLHHLDKIMEAKGERVEKLKNGKVIVGEKYHRESDLAAVFFLNRIEDKTKNKELTETKIINKKNNENKFDQKNDSKIEISKNKNDKLGIEFSNYSEQDNKASNAKTFNLETVKTVDTYQKPLRRKRKGKQYLLKVKKVQSQNHSNQNKL